MKHRPTHPRAEHPLAAYLEDGAEEGTADALAVVRRRRKSLVRATRLSSATPAFTDLALAEGDLRTAARSMTITAEMIWDRDFPVRDLVADGREHAQRYLAALDAIEKAGDL